MSGEVSPPPVLQARPTQAVPWRRLDPRMLLVHPVQEVMRFLPFVVGAFVLGSTGEGRNWWQLAGIAIPIALGVLRFVTTRYRITPTQVELQRGLISRKVLTAPLDRVRAIELTSSPIHRVLGLAKVEIGTASAAKPSEEKFALDSLPLRQARDLRVALLHRNEPDPAIDAGSGGAAAPDVTAQAQDRDQVLMRLDPTWVRYAPLTSSGNVIAAGLLALAGQFAEQAGMNVFDPDRIDSVVARLSIGVALTLVLIVFVTIGAVFAVLGYLVTNWGFTLSRDVNGRSFNVRRGLLTSTETSLERERVRGVEVGEPLGLRMAGAGRLSAIVTGLSRTERGSTQLVPPAPRTVVDAVGAQLLGDPTPISLQLRRHGPAARRRRYTRAFAGALSLPALSLLLSATAGLPWWFVVPALVPLPLAAVLAANRYRRLGHGLTEGFVVFRSGSLRGRRDVLQREGIIGWNIEQSWFQRRAGLVTLVATTAAGRQAYAALDIPESAATALADAAVPGLITPFLADTSQMNGQNAPTRRR